MTNLLLLANVVSLSLAAPTTDFCEFLNNTSQDHMNVDLNNLSTLKNKMDNFIVLFPKTTRRIRFYSTHSKANADRNKGRICLDNFDIKCH